MSSSACVQRSFVPFVLACVLGSAVALAQPVAPNGSQAMPPGHPPVADDAAGDDPHAGGMGDGHPAPPRPIAIAEASKDVPVGTILVRVIDEGELAVANAEVQVGTMSQESGRTSLPGKTNAQGLARFDKLVTGDKLAYRVNVLHDGAKYSSMPFRLPTDQGYSVTIRQLDTTRDARDLVLYIGATSIELKDERLKIVQQVRLLNVGRKVYVFPENGLLVPLPKDAMAFQAEEVMTDQKLKEESGKGFSLHGSIPPGEVTLTWGFDVPREGTSADLQFDLMWPTFAYRVLADAAEGMTIQVDGMPAPELHTDNGRRFYVTETMKNPGEAPLTSVRVHLRGIPGPGPMRFIATALAGLILLGGFAFARRASSPARGASSRPAFADRKDALLARVKSLHAELERGEVGPEFHARTLADLEEELAALLYEEARPS